MKIKLQVILFRYTSTAEAEIVGLCSFLSKRVCSNDGFSHEIGSWACEKQTFEISKQSKF